VVFESYEAGMVFETVNSGNVVIINYYSWDKVLIQFENTGYQTLARAWCIKNGNLKDPYNPSVYGKGFVGFGLYKPRLNGRTAPEYKLWNSMLGRCYAPVSHCYTSCTVNSDWHNFQNFAEWYHKYPCRKEGWQLDKDIHGGENKHYSQDTCTFVPQEINGCISEKPKGDNLRGVFYAFGSYRASVSSNGKRIHLGTFDTEENAFYAYKKAKEQVIYELAEKYKTDIEPRTYQKLVGWQII